MLPLNEKQHQALVDLVDGRPVSDKRTLNALRKRGYLNKYNMPKTNAWHAIGKFRYKPKLKIPEEWEVDAWDGELIAVDEDSGNNSKVYLLDAQKLMKFYRECMLAQQAVIDKVWDRASDYEYEIDSSQSAKTISLRAVDLAREDVKFEWNVSYIGDMLYKIAKSMYAEMRSGMMGHECVSEKSSFLDNEDEFARMAATPGSQIVGKPRFKKVFATIRIDID